MLDLQTSLGASNGSFGQIQKPPLSLSTDAAAAAAAAADLHCRCCLGRPFRRPLLLGDARRRRVRKSVGAGERERAETEALDQSTAISVMVENGVRKTG